MRVRRLQVFAIQWHFVDNKETEFLRLNPFCNSVVLVSYLHSLVVVSSSLLLLWCLSAAEMTTAKESPEQRGRNTLAEVASETH